MHKDLTSPDFGFIEIQNTHSMYYHPARDIKLSMHVDGPLVVTCSDEDQEWLHNVMMLDKMFDTKI